MNKAGKIVLLALSIAVAFLIIAYLFIAAIWSGALNPLLPQKIADYHSPSGEYMLVFEQMGDPQWPFGPTDVRLTLKNHHGKMIERVSAQLFNDGVSAGESNVASVSWTDDAVTVVLRASEMTDTEVVIPYR